MEDIANHNSEKTLSAGSCSSSFIEPNIIVNEKTPIVEPAIVAVDEEKADSFVIIDEKNASNGKGKEKLVLNNFSGHEVNVLDGVIPSPQANEIIEEAIAPELSASASAASGKHAVPASCSSLSGTQSYSNVTGFEDHSKALKSKSLFKSLFSKCCFMPKFACVSKAPPLSRQASQNNVKIHALPYASGTEQPNLTVGAEDAHSHSNSAEFSPSSVDGESDSEQDSLLNKLQLFKKFDISEDPVGHLLEVTNRCFNPSKEWVNYVADEWRMLENDLPDTIYVRAYEARMDLLRAVMVGADGTPYHDGLFFFDVQFPASYPKVPPVVKYHSHGLKINPTLYRSGEVCLSLLLGPGNSTENDYWRPYQSNMLQVLVSIQGLVLNGESFFDDKTIHNKSYKEQIYIDSLKTMIYTMNDPPKHFEDLVNGHFYIRAHDILAACRAYLDGVEVGCYLKGNPQTNAPENIRNCSQYLKMILPSYIKALVKAFTRIGVKDCKKYLIFGDKSEAGASAGIPDI